MLLEVRRGPAGVPSPLLSLIPVLMLMALLFIAVHVFNDSTLDNNDRVILLATATVYYLVTVACDGMH